MANDDKIISILRAKIEAYSDKSADFTEFGKVLSVFDGIAIASGLSNVMLNEVVEFENGTKGIALNLESNTVGIIVMGPYVDIKEGSKVKRTHSVASVPVGKDLVGRVVNPLGVPIDGLDNFASSIKQMPVEKQAPGVMKRAPIDTPLSTGILMIDSMFPIGRGQRELIIGDRQTGKTSIAISTIINQKGKGMKCVYVSIGQKKSSIAQIVRTLSNSGALEYTTVVVSSADDLPSLLYLAPYSGITIAEEWMANGDDVLIVYDDLSKHAVAYRTISLLLRRPPGREAYPGDIFYLHSRLLERSCKMDKKFGGGTISALPIVETQAGDISAYVPTNIISITDGQLFLQTNLFNLNQRPAIDAGLSVSRVGGAAQYKAIKKLSSSLKIDLSQYSEMASFAQFGSDLDESTLNIIEHGKRINEIVKQANDEHYSWIDETLLLFLINRHLIKYVPLDAISDFKNRFIVEGNNWAIMKTIENEKVINDEAAKILYSLSVNFIYDYVKVLDNYSPELLASLENLLSTTVKVDKNKTSKETKETKSTTKKVEEVKADVVVEQQPATATDENVEQTTNEVSPSPEAAVESASAQESSPTENVQEPADESKPTKTKTKSSNKKGGKK